MEKLTSPLDEVLKMALDRPNSDLAVVCFDNETANRMLNDLKRFLSANDIKYGWPRIGNFVTVNSSRVYLLSRHQPCLLRGMRFDGIWVPFLPVQKAEENTLFAALKQGGELHPMV